MKASAEQAIGIFDSGVGGLTVVRAVLRALPQEQLVYLGDTARVPYGGRSLQTILRYSRENAQFLLKQKVKMILVACNTASAAALPQLEAELQVPVLGAIDPGARAAVEATKRGVIGVIATLATIRSGAYPQAIHGYDPHIQVFGLACPLFTPMIEEGWISDEDEIPIQVVRRYLKDLYHRSKEMDTLVLACTHYPLLASVIDKVVRELWPHPVRLVDCASTMARAAQEKLQMLGGLNPNLTASMQEHPLERLQCFVTDEAHVAQIGSRFLGASLQKIKVVNLEHSPL